MLHVSKLIVLTLCKISRIMIQSLRDKGAEKLLCHLTEALNRSALYNFLFFLNCNFEVKIVMKKKYILVSIKHACAFTLINVIIKRNV